MLHPFNDNESNNVAPKETTNQGQGSSIIMCNCMQQCMSSAIVPSCIIHIKPPSRLIQFRIVRHSLFQHKPVVLLWILRSVHGRAVFKNRYVFLVQFPMSTVHL